MTFIKINTNSHFKLSQVITIFKRDETEDHIDSQYYLESHQVLSRKGENLLSEGKPLTLECLDSLTSFLNGKESRMLKGIVPNNLIYQDPNIGSKKFIWYRKAQPTFLKFSGGNRLPKDGLVHLPTLVFMADKKDLLVFATKTAKPGSKSKLYYAPLLNTRTNGRICLGTTRRIIDNELESITDIQEMLNFWEKMLFGSEFTTGEGLGDQMINHEKGLISYIRSLQKTKKEFDTDLLVPSHMTIEKLAKS